MVVGKNVGRFLYRVMENQFLPLIQAVLVVVIWIQEIKISLEGLLASGGDLLFSVVYQHILLIRHPLSLADYFHGNTLPVLAFHTLVVMHKINELCDITQWNNAKAVRRNLIVPRARLK